MPRLDKLLALMRSSPQRVRYAELKAICSAYFGEPRQTGGSHCVFKTPWAGDPRVNIQEGQGGKAKAHQVAQVLAAIERLLAERGKGAG